MACVAYEIGPHLAATIVAVVSSLVAGPVVHKHLQRKADK